MMDETAELFNAIAVNDLATVSRLVDANPALARATNADSLPALRFAKFMRDAVILRTLVEAGPPLTIFEAAMVDDTARTRDILGEHPDAIGSYSDDGFTALHFAAYYGSLDAMRILLDGGAPTEAVTTNFLTNMPLHAAVAGAARQEAASILLEHGADVNARQHHGFSALHTPAMLGDRTLAALLLAHGADPGAKTDEGKTPADIAREQGHTDLAALFRGLDARANATSDGVG
jgi:ankyrin repeat protein